MAAGDERAGGYKLGEIDRLAQQCLSLRRAMLPAGYTYTGTHNGLLVCCLDSDFNRLTASCSSEGLFVLVPSLIPLAEFEKTNSVSTAAEMIRAGEQMMKEQAKRDLDIPMPGQSGINRE